MNEKIEPIAKGLEERESLLEAKQCLGCAHEGMIVTDADGMILEATVAAEHILETPLAGLKGRSVHEFFTAHEAYGDMAGLALREGRSLNHPAVVVAGNGKRKIVNVSIQSAGKAGSIRLVHVFQDCTDLRTLEERLLQSERLATVGRFASQIAHEIRNPLNSISLNIELLEDEIPASNTEARGLIQSVLQELDRLNDIVSEYLQFSRFPKPQLKRGHVDGVIQGLLGSFRPPQRIQMKVQLASSTPELWLDEALLRQVLDNLVRNAVEAIDGEGAIELETDVMDRFLSIRVKDTGAGIPLEIQSKLFEPFFTTKTHGTGLGLATSQQIVFEHNGHLLVESQPGRGSTFSILLPI